MADLCIIPYVVLVLVAIKILRVNIIFFRLVILYLVLLFLEASTISLLYSLHFKVYNIFTYIFSIFTYSIVVHPKYTRLLHTSSILLTTFSVISGQISNSPLQSSSLNSRALVFPMLNIPPRPTLSYLFVTAIPSETGRQAAPLFLFISDKASLVYCHLHWLPSWTLFPLYPLCRPKHLDWKHQPTNQPTSRIVSCIPSLVPITLPSLASPAHPKAHQFHHRYKATPYLRIRYIHT